MAIYNANTGIAEMYVGNVKIVEAYLGDELIFGNTQTVVTYNVDDGESYSETYNQGDSVLSPQTFTPTKTGYTFLGWREDDTASSDVLVTKTASGATMSLYAVFQKTVTVTYYTGASSSATAQTTTGTQYYNNTNTLDPTFNLTCDPIANWTVRGWTTASSGGASTIDYQDATDFTTGSDITIYSCYTRVVTVTYNANGGSGTTANSNGIAYHHSLSGSTNAAIVLSSCSYTRSSYKFIEWTKGSTSGSAYAAGSTYSGTGDVTMYAKWYSTAKVTFSCTGAMQSYTAPVAGTYKLEVYGAQGNNYSGATTSNYYGIGGKGAYAYGNVSLTKGQVIYIGVGKRSNGWNGGGAAKTSGYCGGGASHIGKSNAVLASTAAANVFLVAAGGGGGGHGIDNSSYYATVSNGGYGGTTQGGSGVASDPVHADPNSSWYDPDAREWGTGATQSAGGYWYRDSTKGKGSFGKGGTGVSDNSYAAGGGGGYYGGGASIGNYNGVSGGGGGSSYIGGTSATRNYSANQRSGDGVAYITPPA